MGVKIKGALNMRHTLRLPLYCVVLGVAFLFLFGILVPALGASPQYYAQADGGPVEPATRGKPEVQPNPLRTICAMEWDAYYKREKVDIDVSTRGDKNEILVLSCQLCSLEENFIDPFLNSVYHGVTGMERIRRCGFKKVVFKGGAGINEIVREVPE